jgi:hypothetical protein
VPAFGRDHAEKDIATAGVWLQMADAFEQATQHGNRRPAVVEI